MNHLEDFREMINGIDDMDLLEEGLSMLRDMIEINEMKERLAKLESGLLSGQRAIFYFFTEGLDKDEVPFAAERISGRIKRLDRELQKVEREKNKKAQVD
jgi:hypothetical protein